MEDNDRLRRGETDLDNMAHVSSHSANFWLSSMKSEANLSDIWKSLFIEVCRGL